MNKRHVVIGLAVAGVFVVAGSVGFALNARSDADSDRKARFEAEQMKAVAEQMTKEAQSDARTAETDAQLRVDVANANTVSSLKDRENALVAQATAQAAQQKTLDAATAGLKASQFGDGIFEVGRDIEPGKYHTEGTTRCYYALLDSSDTSDIADNANTTGPVTVVINTPYFTSHGCGTWTKVG